MILDTKNNIIYNEIEISENELQQILKKNFEIIFPDFTFISDEFSIQGDVRMFGMSGRIDIIAYDKIENRLVIVELKKNHTKNILIQALDYSDFIEENYEKIIMKLKTLSLKKRKNLIKESKPPKIILIAKEFLHPTVRRSKNLTNEIILFNYKMFSDGIFSIERANGISKSKNNNLIKVSNENRDNFNNQSIIQLIKNIIDSKIIDEKYYLVRDEVLIINPTRLYNAFGNFYVNSGFMLISKKDFMKKLKSSESFLDYRKSMNFKNNCTSVVLMRMY